jgi:hypothetical protein
MFSLRKHYFDAVLPDGSVVINYDAVLRLAGIPWPFRYSSRLFAPATGKPVLSHWASSAAITGMAQDDCEEILDVGTKIEVRLPGDVAAAWRARQSGWRQDVLLDDSKSGRFIAWQCRSPACEVDLGNGWPLASGYAETLRLRLRRPSIPIDRLHWGRFVADGCSLVWIVWEGPEPRRLAWLNGESVELGHFATSGAGEVDIRVLGADFSSELTREIVARPIDVRFSVAMGWLAALLPRALRHLEERKHLGRGRLRLAAGVEIEGWTLSETVNLKTGPT